MFQQKNIFLKKKREFLFFDRIFKLHDYADMDRLMNLSTNPSLEVSTFSIPII